MDTIGIDGVILTPLKIIENDLGNVLHAFKKDTSGFNGFGEAYFSTVKKKSIKGWKKHAIMISNLVVPMGQVKFVIYDDRSSSPTKGNILELILSPDNYQRLTIPAGLWFSFQGQGPDTNLILNIANILHDPNEVETLLLSTEKIPYTWS